jgi:hypothetical protein
MARISTVCDKFFTSVYERFRASPGAGRNNSGRCTKATATGFDPVILIDQTEAIDVERTSTH